MLVEWQRQYSKVWYFLYCSAIDVGSEYAAYISHVHILARDLFGWWLCTCNSLFFRLSRNFECSRLPLGSNLRTTKIAAEGVRCPYAAKEKSTDVLCGSLQTSRVGAAFTRSLRALRATHHPRAGSAIHLASRVIQCRKPRIKWRTLSVSHRHN